MFASLVRPPKWPAVLRKVSTASGTPRPVSRIDDLCGRWALGARLSAGCRRLIIEHIVLIARYSSHFTNTGGLIHRKECSFPEKWLNGDNPSVWTRINRGASNSHQLLVSNLPGDLATRWYCSRRTLRGRQLTRFDLCFAAACWELWKQRNTRIFNDRATRSDELGKGILDTVKLWTSVFMS
uniref:Uncharacterized protein n=1 Tax=Ananas comosus var. bracteatus TaxID=296719 RepID=A0A6V7NI16_ANACO|nr:unnamed protein product [Ananas comosus var. bracteatus]